MSEDDMGGHRDIQAVLVVESFDLVQARVEVVTEPFAHLFLLDEFFAESSMLDGLHEIQKPPRQ
jgi:hypothetical protein